MQESRYDLAAKRKHCGLDAETETTQVCVITDYGISQIHYKNLKRFNFDKERLLTDLQYSVDAGAQVLSQYSKYARHQPKSWPCRYNQGLRRYSLIEDGCRTYMVSVQRYF